MAFKFVAVALAGTLLLAGCGRREALPSRPPPPTIVTPPAPAVSADDYMKLHSSSSLLIVRASELAIERSKNARTLEIASRLKGDHTGIAAQLSFAGRRLNSLPSASLLMLDQVLYDGLLRASDFDVAYMRTMRATVENCRAGHAGYAENGSSPTLRQVARFAAETCQQELRIL